MGCNSSSVRAVDPTSKIQELPQPESSNVEPTSKIQDLPQSKEFYVKLVSEALIEYFQFDGSVWTDSVIAIKDIILKDSTCIDGSDKILYILAKMQVIGPAEQPFVVPDLTLTKLTFESLIPPDQVLHVLEQEGSNIVVYVYQIFYADCTQWLTSPFMPVSVKDNDPLPCNPEEITEYLKQKHPITQLVKYGLPKLFSTKDGNEDLKAFEWEQCGPSEQNFTIAKTFESTTYYWKYGETVTLLTDNSSFAMQVKLDIIPNIIPNPPK